MDSKRMYFQLAVEFSRAVYSASLICRVSKVVTRGRKQAAKRVVRVKYRTRQ